jgi:hypothetical protein
LPCTRPGGRYGDLRRVTGRTGFAQGGLDEPHAARNSQDASPERSESEAWIGDEEGSINVR